VMHEVNNPLEAIGNLVFLTRAGASDASLVYCVTNRGEYFLPCRK
jgi:hypothetical protein